MGVGETAAGGEERGAADSNAAAAAAAAAGVSFDEAFEKRFEPEPKPDKSEKRKIDSLRRKIHVHFRCKKRRISLDVCSDIKLNRGVI